MRGTKAEAAEFFCSAVREDFNTNGEVKPCAFIFSADHQDLVPFVGIPKEMFVNIVKLFAMERNATSVVFISENWSHAAATKEDLNSLYEKHGPSLSGWPRELTEEIVTVLLEFRDGKQLFSAVIDPDNRSLGEWKEANAKIDGRLANFLPRYT